MKKVIINSPTAILSFLMLLILLAVNLSGGYGYFRDEFYYIACSNNLDWGYVDHPFLSIIILHLQMIILGDSIFAIRLIPALAAAGLVFLSGQLVRELGGGKFAQFLASLSVMFAPVYLAVSSFYSMNVFEPLFWIGCTFIIVKIINTDNRKLWLLFGIVAGLGVQNKHSMLFFGFAVVVSLLISNHRNQLANKCFWVGSLCAAIIILPNILWQAAHNWPTLEFMKNAQQWKNAPMSPFEFLKSQILFQHPFTFPLWATGLFALFFNKNLKKYSFFASTFIILFVLFVIQRGKPYYLSPVYPLLLSAGAIAFEQFSDHIKSRVLIPGYAILLLILGFTMLPLWVPILPVEKYIEFSTLLGMQPPKMEKHQDTSLPQVFADRFGWAEMIEAVAKAYNSLTPEEKSESTIYAQNYGEAGAIDFIGKQYNLPKAISGHNNYWLWGFHNASGKVVIIVGGEKESHEEAFKSVEIFTTHKHKYAMPFENNLSIFICREPVIPLKNIWNKLKIYI